MAPLTHADQMLNATDVVSDTKYLDRMLSSLPSRYGKLLIDRITYFEPDKSLTCIKNVTRNENVFSNNNANFPSLHILEALVQACSVITTYHSMNKLDSKDYELLSEIKSAKFNHPVVAGDQLLISVTVLQKKPYLWEMEAVASTELHIVANTHVLFTKENTTSIRPIG